MNSAWLYLTLTLQQSVRPGHAFAPLPTGSVAPAEQQVSSPARQGVVRGQTASRLDEVRGPNNSAPYQVGQRGVLALTEETVTYELEQVTYHTRLADGFTTYEFGFVQPPAQGPAQWPDPLLPAHCPPLVDDQLQPERHEGPLLTAFYSLGRASTLAELF